MIRNDIYFHKDWFPPTPSNMEAEFADPVSLICLDRYTVLSAIIICSLLMLLIIIITRSKTVVSKIPSWIAVLPAVMLGLRLIFPIELYVVSFTINSERIMPIFVSIMDFELFTAGSFSLTIWTLFCLIWGIVAGILLLKYIIDYYTLFQLTKKIPQTDNKQTLKALERVKKENNFRFTTKIIENNCFDSPFEYGLFKQSVFIGQKDYTEDELYYILNHELTHFHNKSNFIKVFLTILGIIFWWNPIVRLFKNHTENLLEVFVDRSVTKKLPRSHKAEYMRYLYNEFINAREPSISREVIGIPMAKKGDSKVLFKRLKTITKNNKINIPISIAMLLLTLFFTAASCRYLFYPSYEIPDISGILADEEIMSSDEVYFVREGEYYMLYYKGGRFSENPLELFGFKTDDINELKENIPEVRNVSVINEVTK